jgi:Amt family ammonium transporter
MVSIPGACSGIVVGLVVITPGAGFVQPGYALLMGAIGGAAVFLFLLGKKYYFHIDDTLDVFSCHGLGGLVGTLLTGVFCQTDVNNSVSNGALYGRPIQLWYQTAGILVVIVYSAVCTAAILLPMHFTIGIRINRLDQIRGLDNIAHGVIIEEPPTQQVKPPILKQKPVVQSWQ